MAKAPPMPRKAYYLKGGTEPSHYPEPILPEFAFIGRSNAGKSTLINTLTGVKSLARTSSTPGRTQAIQFFRLERGMGTDIVFADLPGYGYAKAPIGVRKQFIPMVERYLDVRRSLAGVVLLADVRRDPSDQEEALIDRVCEREIPLLLVLSKSDKLAKSKLRLRVREVARAYDLDPEHFFPYSGLTNAGRDELWRALVDLAADWCEQPPDAAEPAIVEPAIVEPSDP